MATSKAHKTISVLNLAKIIKYKRVTRAQTHENAFITLTNIPINAFESSDNML